MNKSPGFDQIAVGIMNRMGLYDDVVTKLDIVEQLRQVWNARGAADGQALKAELQRALATQTQGVTINLEAMIKALDVPETPTPTPAGLTIV